MNALDRIRKAHVSIMSNLTWCAYGPLLAYGKTEITEEVPTAATDGVDKLYNPDFVAKLNDAELRFVVLHEATHCAYQHMHVWREISEENPTLANIAMDYFVNTALVDSDAGAGFITMPSIGIPPEPKYRGWTVGRIYADLKQQAKNNGGAGSKQGFDQHRPANGTTPQHSETIERLVRQGEIIKSQRERLAGGGSGNTSGMFGALLAPRADWRKVLREFMTENCQSRDDVTWRRPNRRYLQDDIYMPSVDGEGMGDLVVGFDTSGSCFGTPHMTRVVTEIQAIVDEVKPARVVVAYWDTRVVDHQIFEGSKFEVKELKPRGGGGTDGACLFDWLRKERIDPQAVVQFTDGEVGSWGRSTWPTVWAVTTDRRAPFGTTIKVEV